MASSVGRPSIQVNVEEVEDMKKTGMTMTEITQIMGISRSTLYRKLEDSSLIGYTDISDSELDDLAIRYKSTHPHDGERMLIGYLRSQNVHVQRWRIRQSILRVDPEGVRERSVKLIQRRSYHVKGPNHVWHMDGNHKLIRWKFVIHGAVDGYSRLVTFLTCSTNNKASTVLDSFVTVVHKHGVPLKIRTDLGGENVDAWEYMINYHGNESCVITGSSVHNERIERLWRDVSRSVIIPFKEMFINLEDDGILDVQNETDLFCLHEVFCSRINVSLNQFISSWNSHPLTSENNRTPLQLFSLDNSESDSSDSDSDSSRHLPTSEPAVEVATLSFIPCVFLHSQVKVLSALPSRNQGRDIFERVARLVGTHVANGCSDCFFL